MKKCFSSNLNFGFLTTRVSRLLTKTVSTISEQKNVNIPIHEMGIISDLKKKEGVLQQDLASSMIRNKSSITKMLERLEKEDYIRKEADSIDARGKRIFLTKKGRSMSDFMNGVLPETHKIAFEGLSEADMKIALKVLDKIYNNLLDYNSNLPK